jgi:hypothetical protein
MPDVRVPLEKSAALETLEVCAECRAWGNRGRHAFYAAVRCLTARAAEKLPAPPMVILVAIAVTLGSAQTSGPAAVLCGEDMNSADSDGSRNEPCGKRAANPGSGSTGRGFCWR